MIESSYRMRAWGVALLMAVLSLTGGAAARAEESEPQGSLPAQIHIRVPANAVLWFNNDMTRKTGETRVFLTPPLAVGHEYAYTVRVRWWDGQRQVEHQRRVVFQAGDQLNLDFFKVASARGEPVPPPAREAVTARPTPPPPLPGPDDTRSFLATRPGSKPAQGGGEGGEE